MYFTGLRMQAFILCTFRLIRRSNVAQHINTEKGRRSLIKITVAFFVKERRNDMKTNGKTPK